MSKIKKCKYCGTTENLVMKGKYVTSVCKEHLSVYKSESYYRNKHKRGHKKCRYCGTTENLVTYSNGKVLNTCEEHKELFYKDASVKGNKIKKCRYCGTTENLAKSGKKLLSVCEEHYELYTKDNYKKISKKRLKNKSCLICGTKDNLVKIGNNTYNSCNEHYQQYKELVKDKKKKTSLKNFGVDVPMKHNLVKEKIKNTFNERYGVDNISKLPHIREKAKKTMLSKYGVEYAHQSDVLMQRKIDNNIEKYGVKNYSQSDEYKTRYREKYWDTFILKLSQKNIIPLFDKKEYINLDKELKYKCNRCYKIFATNDVNVQHINCGCSRYRSSYEDEIYNWLYGKYSNSIIEKNKRFFKDGNKLIHELDIYLPEHNIGIEFHGLYWHSDIVVDANYHKNKFLFFKEKNIDVIQIFENEWVNKQDIVKSIILSKLNTFDKKIYARETNIKVISNYDYRLFLEWNHIQGAINSSIRLGLYYNNELISVLGIGKSRFKDGEIEIHRFCNKLNTQVIGGFSKLLSYYKRHYSFDSITSYVDLRYFDGSGYIKNGFKIDSISKPNYYYFSKRYYSDNNFVLHSRIDFQKHKLKDKLEKFDPNKTEYENMLDNNYLRIFDAGNYKLIYTGEFNAV